MGIIHILMSMGGDDVALASCLKSCFQIIALAVFIVLGVGVCVIVYRNFFELRH